jgi:hypothetical protein
MMSSRNVPYWTGRNYFPNFRDLQAAILAAWHLPCRVVLTRYLFNPLQDFLDDFRWFIRDIHDDGILRFF